MDLLETIRIENGEVFNLDYHQERFDRSRLELFNSTTNIELSSLIEAPKDGLFRCRILYDVDIKSIKYIPYKAKEIKQLKVVSSNIDYSYKYANREELNTLLLQNSKYDEIIIEKNGFITDTTIANIAFYDNYYKQWFTPETPLLKGTMREKLLKDGLLKTKNIESTEISTYKKVALMNAMIGFKIINPIINYQKETL